MRPVLNVDKIGWQWFNQTACCRAAAMIFRKIAPIKANLS
jgi:hypothetical protein